MPLSLRLVALLLFGSGFSALVYQTAWQRMFRLTFGASTGASAAVLAIFLGGLGLGGVFLGRRVERSERPLAFYGNLEVGIALLAAVSPLLRAGVHEIYLALGGTQTLGVPVATAVRLLLTALVIGPAAVLMGGTLPAVARAVVSEADQGRSRLALLYSVNTVGAVFGALLGPLLLFGLLGTELSLWGAASVNLLVAVVARSVGRNVAPVPVTEFAPTSAEPAVPRSKRLDGVARWTETLVYVVAAVVGFAFLALELVWFRILTPMLGGSSLTFGLILAAALLGIGVGGYLYSLRSPERPATLELLAATLGAEAVAVLLPFAWGEDLALVAAHLRAMSNLGFGYLVAGWILVALVVVFPASVVSGYQFPALIALLGRGRSGIARHVGKAYAFNTIGTLTGSLISGFVLLPSLGAVTAWRCLALLLALLALICTVFAWRGGARGRRLAPALASVPLAGLLAMSFGPGAVFRHSPVGAGRVDLADLSENEVVGFRRNASDVLLWARDGVESSIAINVQDGVALIVNGKSDGAVVVDGDTQAFLGLLPAALHGSPKRAFVVGLGTGMTAGLLAGYPGVERVEVAELEPSVVEVARQSALANANVLQNPRVQILFGDGRELLLTSKRKYDLIVSEPSNPYRAGVAALFTREFYEAAASRLANGALFAQWLQGYEVDASAIATALRTLRSVFPHVSMWGVGGDDLVLIGSFAPQVIPMDRLRRTLQEPRYLEWMRRLWKMEGAEAFVAHHLLPPRLVDPIAERVSSAVNTDDLNLLEFSFGRRVGDDSYAAISDLEETLRGIDHRPSIAGSIDWDVVDERRRRLGWEGHRTQPPSARTQATLAGCAGNMKRAEELWPAGAAPDEMVEVWITGWIAAMHGSNSALTSADRLASAGFEAEAMLLRAHQAEARGDPEAAARLLIEALDKLRSKALPLCDASGSALRHAASLAVKLPGRAPDLLRAVAKGPFAVYQNEAYRRAVQTTIGRSDKPVLCMQAFGNGGTRPAWELETLALRVDCFERSKASDAELARADLRAFLKKEPETFADRVQRAVRR